jgi:hypothetical protein
MEMMTKAAIPGDAHKRLQALVGEWKTKTTFWYEPGEKPEVSEGSSSHTWALGGRYLDETFHGSWAGKPYTGRGMLGYDNVLKEYVSTWADDASTTLMTSRGRFDEKSNQLIMTSIHSCPMTGGMTQSVSKTKIIDFDNHVMEMYRNSPSGEQYKMMEIVFTRLK